MHYNKALHAAKMAAGHPDLDAPTFVVMKKRLLAPDPDTGCPDSAGPPAARTLSDDLIDIANQLLDASGKHAAQADRLRALARRIQTEPESSSDG